MAQCAAAFCGHKNAQFGAFRLGAQSDTARAAAKSRGTESAFYSRRLERHPVSLLSIYQEI
jgi:hypothetical protein